MPGIQLDAFLPEGDFRALEQRSNRPGRLLRYSLPVARLEEWTREGLRAL